jgi:hypothetical protein
MAALSLAFAAAKAVGLTDWIGEKISGNETAAKVLEIASQVTGISDPHQAVAAIENDPNFQAEMKKEMLNNEHELNMAAYADRKDARDMYKHNSTQADKIANMVFKWNIPAICGLVLLNVLLIIFPDVVGDAGMLVGNIIGIAVKSLFDERKEITGFYFGSSMHNSSDGKG